MSFTRSLWISRISPWVLRLSRTTVAELDKGKTNILFRYQIDKGYQILTRCFGFFVRISIAVDSELHSNNSHSMKTLTWVSLKVYHFFLSIDVREFPVELFRSREKGLHGHIHVLHVHSALPLF